MEQPKSVSDAILQEGVDFTVSVANRNILHKLKILKPEKKFVIFPICLGSLFKISKQLIDVKMNAQKDGLTDAKFIQMGIESIIENKDRMIKIIAYAIHNKQSEPPKSLFRYLNRNLNSKEALSILSVVIKQMDIQDFLAFMMSVGGMNLLASPTTGESSEELSSTSDSILEPSSGVTVGATS